MTRDTRSAYRARQKATNDSVDAAVAELKAARDAEWKAAQEARAAAEANQRRFTRDDVLGATHVIDRFGKLREVVRVNQKTVSVTTPYSWTETVPFDRVRGVRHD